jgi:restriction system protein
MDKNVVLSYHEEYTRNYRKRYVADIMHTKYAEHKIIKDYDKSIVRQKVDKLIEKWQEMDNRIKSAEFAHNKNLEIKKLNQGIENILLDGLVQNLNVFTCYKNDAESELSELYASIKNTKYSLGKLQEPSIPKDCLRYEYPIEPQQSDFTAEYKTIHKIFPFLKSRADSKKKLEFDAAYNFYLRNCSYVDELNNTEKTRYEKETKRYSEDLSKYRRENDRLTKKLQKDEDECSSRKKEIHHKINAFKDDVNNRKKEAIEEYCSLLLEYSIYPIEYDKNIVLTFNSDMLAIDYSLPSVDTFPSLAEMKFTKGQSVAVPMTEKVFSKHYDDALYQISLRSIYEIFADKYLSPVNSVAFNGWVTALNKANGKTETNCILSIKTNREQIAEIDFMNVSPKACFKSLKGIASSRLSTITAIQPIVTLNKSDKRFVEHYDISTEIDSFTNLASMHWEDFEHLIRELFEKEFSYNGGEVKVTQASRDGGVDAVAFDPDPIRGGKIVIQAKRYTNTVGVSAVRDLYGTVLNEGATKGILVTTSDYGGDSYEFAKDKPITLMNGSNLLYLLEKHGQHARIDINEARKLMANE